MELIEPDYGPVIVVADDDDDDDKEKSDNDLNDITIKKPQSNECCLYSDFSDSSDTEGKNINKNLSENNGNKDVNVEKTEEVKSIAETHLDKTIGIEVTAVETIVQETSSSSGEKNTEVSIKSSHCTRKIILI